MEQANGRDPLLTARAQVLHDLTSSGIAGAREVSVVEEALSQRRWWLAQWEAGHDFVAGLVAQDVQDSLFDDAVRWPICQVCQAGPIHSLSIEPELGADPHWACSESGEIVARLGQLEARREINDAEPS